ncbi:OLC1v1016086C1 [Oldenlandia corymbosa var. corymbosa]|uniref:OLC1v1016086C1 n=1 Tax=Oldenlandia corymbosa var. corymbosa TaxID=529605 RepID=A0AAV1E4X8_OLDCO|nr:OLC1v1016086C1 [Oldenlandia corymbosa var. corymbosa]
MAFRAVASVVIQKLTDMLTQESVINERRLVNELKRIKKALETMEGYFLDAESESKRCNAEVKDWAETYLKHLYQVEDAIETSASRFPLRKGTFVGKLVKLTFGLAFLKNYRLCRKMKKIRYQIDGLNRIRPLGLDDLSVNSTPLSYQNNNFEALIATNVAVDHPISSVDEDEDHASESSNRADSIRGRLTFEDRPVMNGGGKLRIMSNASVFADRINQSKLIFNYSFDEEGLDILAFKQDVISLAQKLTDIGSDGGSREVVSIVGERGSGKTTLARAVFGNRQVKDHFQSCTAWVTASRTSSNATADLWLKLLREISSSQDNGGGDPEQLKLKVHDLLKDKRYLVVLDDVENLNMWDDLRSAFPDQQQNGSKILLITCEKAVATHADSQLHLKKLNDHLTWSLFLKKAGLVNYPEEDLKTRILQICNCLPLNIVLLGSLLSTKEHDKWGDLLHSLANWGTLDLISFCYDDLPDHLKLCLIYMVLFPKEFDIPVRRLQRLWLAEGFVKQSSREIFQEDVVKGYFDELVKRSLIQVSKLTSDGSPKRCRLLGVLHDHLIPKSQVISLFHVHNKYSCTSCPGADSVFNRRLIEYTDIKQCSLKPTDLGSLRSYLSFNIQKKDIPAAEVGKFLSSILSNGLRLLRVLDLEGVYKPTLPDNLGDFFHLRYLGLRWTFLDTFPESIGRLSYLETLDIKHTLISTLPPFIWKMKHLKHLNANGNQLDLPGHSCSSLPQLMTLSGFSVDDKSLERDCLKSLVHLRELELTFQLSNSAELLCWISNLTAIQALRLRSKDEMGRPSKLSWMPLSNLKQLTHLNLLGNLERLPDKNDFPQGLKVLTLAVSQLKEDPMPILGELPNLTALRLLANSYLGTSITCPAGGFKELRVLKLWMLKNLEHWYVEEGAMGKLKEVNIRCCDKLEMIPEELLQQINELTLTNMSPEFKSQVESTNPMHLSIISNHYDFSPLPWERGNGSSENGLS